MSEPLSLKDWLNQQPLPAEIRYNEDGSSYIPIEFIKPKLDYLSPKWNTLNFNHFFYTVPDGRLFCSANVELSIEYSIYTGSMLVTVNKRQLSGSATFDVQRYYPNTNWGQTALSLCIVAAAKELGVFFGKELNKNIITVPNEQKQKRKADIMIKKQMANAVVANDQPTIDNLNKTYDFV